MSVKYPSSHDIGKALGTSLMILRVDDNQNGGCVTHDGSASLQG